MSCFLPGVVLLVLFSAFPGVLEAQPRSSQSWRELQRLRYSLSLKVPTRLNFRVIRDGQGRPMLTGQLLDDRDVGIRHQPLQLRLPQQKTRHVITDDRGQFRLSTEGWPKQGAYGLAFLGDIQYAASQSQRMVDLRRVDLAIRAQFPASLPTGTQAFSIMVRLQYQGHAQENLPVTLLMPSTTAPRQVRGTGPTVSLPLVPESAAFSGVKLNPLMTLYTNQQGTVRFVWQGQPLQGPVQLPMTILFPGNDYFLPQQLQRFLIVTPETAETSSFLWWGLGLLALVLWMGLVGLRKMRQWLLFRAISLPSEPAPEISLPIDTGSISWAASSEDFSVMLNDSSIAGVVLAVGTQQPLAGVRVTVSVLGSIDLSSDTQPITVWEKTTTDARGFFLVSLPSSGAVSLSFSHAHVQTKQMELTLPHRSHNKILRVFLASYRHLIYETFVMTARSRWSQKPYDPKSQTVREWLLSLPTDQAERLEPLAKAFEESYYGANIPTAQDYETLCDFFQTRTLTKGTRPHA